MIFLSWFLCAFVDLFFSILFCSCSLQFSTLLPNSISVIRLHWLLLQLFPTVVSCCFSLWRNVAFRFLLRVFFFSETTRYVKINPLSTRKKKQKRKQLLATRTSAWQDACVARKKQFLTTFNFQTVYATNKYQTEKFRSAKQSPKPTWHDRYHGEVKLVLWRMTFQDGADLK